MKGKQVRAQSFNAKLLLVQIFIFEIEFLRIVSTQGHASILMVLD